ncbi:MAG: ATP-grasp domain-containing protein [Bacteroidales bacterium]|nr:ATP-grasp domain-containing protein [Bacteroidales bacterium]
MLLQSIVELRVDAEGVIIPIEINPFRFGGWCTTADLLGIATGFSPYEFYLKNQRPDWEEVLKEIYHCKIVTERVKKHTYALLFHPGPA